MLNGEQVRELYNKVGNGDKDALQAMRDLFIDLYLRYDDLEKEHAVTRKAATALARDNKSYREIFAQIAQARGMVAPSPQENGAAVEAPVDAASMAAAPIDAGEVVGADGRPLDPATAAAEAAMEAAAGPRPGEGPRFAQPQAPHGNGNGRKVRRGGAPQAAAPMTEDDAQAAAEAAMDAAAGPRE